MAPRFRRVADALDERRTAMNRRHLLGKSRRRSSLFRRSLSRNSMYLPELLCGILSMDKQGQDSSSESSAAERGSSSVEARVRGSHGRMYDTSEMDGSSEYVSDSPSTVDTADNESLTGVTEPSQSSRPSSSTSVSSRYPKQLSSTTLVKDTRSLRKKKSLVRVINKYLRAMVQEGKRHAQKYIRKALSFGVNTGYLMPCDAHGKVLRVSSSLLQAARKSNPILRDHRRRLRRGEDEKADERKKLRPGSTLWPSKKQDSPDKEPLKPSTSKKRRRSRENSTKSRKRTRSVRRKKSAVEELPAVKSKRKAKKSKTPIAEKPSKAKRGGKREARVSKKRSEPPKDLDKLRVERRPEVSHDVDSRLRENGYCREEEVADDPRFVVERGRSSLGRETRSAKCEKVADPSSVDEREARTNDNGKNMENLEEPSNENDRNATRSEA